MTVDFKQRNREIVALIDCGQSYSSIGNRFGICPSRVMDIYKKEKSRITSEKAHADAIAGKTTYTFYDALWEVCENESQATRIFRCLYKAGILNEIETNNGTLDTYSDETLLEIRNFGTISLIFARRANKLYKQKRFT